MTILVTGAAGFVTGAAGFVGLNVVEHLLRAGRSVAGLDRIDLPPRARRLFPSLPGSLTWTSGSVQSASDLSRALTSAPVQAVIHCAVITAGTERERRDPEGIVATNVGGATTTLAAAARHGVGRFIYPSSVAVYGTAARGVDLVREDEVPPRPVMLYGLTKLACETLLPRVAEVGGIEFAAARLASVYGPWEYATGARDTLSPMLSALRHARTGTEAVLGPPGLGNFIYARDAAAGLVALADAPAPRRTIYNLGSGEVASAAHWCQALATLVPGFRWRLAATEEMPNTVSHVPWDRGALDVARLAADAGWAPRFAMAQAAADYLAWDAEDAAATRE